MEIDHVIWSLEPDIQEGDKGLESDFLNHAYVMKPP